MPIARYCTAAVSDDCGRLNPVVEYQRQAETRVSIQRVQWKIGERSIFGKWPTRKGLSLIFWLSDPEPQTRERKDARKGFLFGPG